MKKEIMFTGRGGQGLGAMGRILALSAILEGKKVASAPSYGGEVTGGLSQSEVIISDVGIDFPAVLDPDVLIVFSPGGYETLALKMTKEALIICDPYFVDHEKVSGISATIILIPATKIALENFGKSRFANIVMLGAFVAWTNIVKPESVIEVIKEEFRGKNPDLNKKAFQRGLKKSGSCSIGEKSALRKLFPEGWIHEG